MRLMIADVKRRMRWRRFLLVVAIVAVIGTAVGLTLGLRSPSSSRGAAALEKREREERQAVLKREARLRLLAEARLRLLAKKERQRQLVLMSEARQRQLRGGK